MLNLQIFRRTMFEPFLNARALSKALGTTQKKASETFFTRPELLVTREYQDSKTGKSVTETLVDVRRLDRMDKLRFVSRAVYLLEEHIDLSRCQIEEEAEKLPMLAHYCDLEAHFAAVYRAIQFEYIRAASAGLGLCQRDALIAVSHGFAMNPDILFSIADDYARNSGVYKNKPYYESDLALLQINEFQRFVEILSQMQRVVAEGGDLYAENKEDGECNPKILDGLLRSCRARFIAE